MCVMMGVYQYFHVCFRVESGRNKSLVLRELVQHCLTQDGLYNGRKEVGGGKKVGEGKEVGGEKEVGKGRRWEVGEGGKEVGDRGGRL